MFPGALEFACRSDHQNTPALQVLLICKFHLSGLWRRFSKIELQLSRPRPFLFITQSIPGYTAAVTTVEQRRQRDFARSVLEQFKNFLIADVLYISMRANVSLPVVRNDRLIELVGFASQ